MSLMSTHILLYIYICTYIYIYYAYIVRWCQLFFIKKTTGPNIFDFFPPKMGVNPWKLRKIWAERAKASCIVQGFTVPARAADDSLIIHWSWRIWFNGKNTAKKKWYCFLIMKMISEYEWIWFVHWCIRKNKELLSRGLNIYCWLSGSPFPNFSMIHLVDTWDRKSSRSRPFQFSRSSPNSIYSWWSHYFWCLIPP